MLTQRNCFSVSIQLTIKIYMGKKSNPTTILTTQILAHFQNGKSERVIASLVKRSKLLYIMQLLCIKVCFNLLTSRRKDAHAKLQYGTTA